MSVTAARAVSPGRAWLMAARPATLPAAAVPVIVGTAAAIAERAELKPLVFFATLTCALLIQIGTNFANDYSDFHRGADNESRLGPTRVTQSGLIQASAVKRGIIVAFGLAVVIGIYLSWIGGWPIIAIGVASVIAGLAYTGGPFPLGYHGLGDLFVFVFFGIVAVTGSAYLQSGAWSSFAFWLSIPIGLLATNILVVNNLRDLPTDIAAGKRTLATRIGDRATRVEYLLFLFAAFAIPVSIAIQSSSRRMLLICLASLPPAIRLARGVGSNTSGRDLNPILRRSGRFLLVFGLFLALGTAMSRSALP